MHTLLSLPTGILWLKDESLSDSENLPAPDVIAQEIMDDLAAALEPMRELRPIWALAASSSPVESTLLVTAAAHAAAVHPVKEPYGVSLLIRVPQLPSAVRVPPQLPPVA